MSIKIQTTWGDIVMDMADGKIRASRLPSLKSAPRKPFAVIRAASTNGVVDKGALRDAERFAKQLFSGGKDVRPAFHFPDGPDFHRKVWKALLRIPAGRTRTYGDIARTIGHPRAARAVGQACGANPLPLVIPCHRVTAANGRLGGFSCGLPWKKLLLECERG